MEAITTISESDHRSVGLEDQQIAKLAKWAIRVAGHSQREVADALGISESTMTRRLCGEQPFTAKELMRLARFLDVDLSTFYPSGVDAA
ncbi:helix-turn-helix domain-containing protein [Rhodococcus hoagii]|nr:helix-turn-helix domain-containing protein [Prescottella equi]MBM4650948.1 helix-turn-helix domain-containing protein [Prescottella equi]MBM4686705.1 helix-turn-helix domain-containing protein [Prescottella equi]